MPERTILLGEDDPALRNVLTECLRRDYTVTPVTTGDEVLAQLGRRPDVVVFDWHLPGTDKTALLAELDAADVDPAVIVISGIEPTVDLEESPADGFFEKPFRADELRDVIMETIPEITANPQASPV